jgi:small-conductance mechanosensitive channel
MIEDCLTFLDKFMPTARGTTVWRSAITLLVVGLFGMGALAWKLLPANVDAAIDNNKTILAHSAALVQAQTAVVDAKNEAQEAAKKADSLLATQLRIFDALKQGHDDTENVLLKVTATNQSLDDVKERLTRIEAKQDQASR